MIYDYLQKKSDSKSDQFLQLEIRDRNISLSLSTDIQIPGQKTHSLHPFYDIQHKEGCPLALSSVRHSRCLPLQEQSPSLPDPTMKKTVRCDPKEENIPVGCASNSETNQINEGTQKGAGGKKYDRVTADIEVRKDSEQPVPTHYSKTKCSYQTRMSHKGGAGKARSLLTAFIGVNLLSKGVSAVAVAQNVTVAVAQNATGIASAAGAVCECGFTIPALIGSGGLGAVVCLTAGMAVYKRQAIKDFFLWIRQ